MNVLHVTPYYWPAAEWGGPTRSIPQLVQALARTGTRIRVETTTTRARPDLPTLESGTRIAGDVAVRFHHCFGPRRYFVSTSLAVGVRERLADVDLVHIHGLWSFPALAAATSARRAGVPYVLSPRGMLSDWGFAERRLKKAAYVRLFAERLIRGAARLHVTTAQEAADMPERFRSLPWRVVPNCVDVSEFAAIEPRVHGPAPSLLVLGRIHPVKGIDLALRALLAVRRTLPDATLTLAGHDEVGHRAELEADARRLGLTDAIRFTGGLDREGVVRELDRADVVLVPSRHESFSLAAAEALAAARPLVLSSAVAIAAEVAAEGAARLIPPDASALAEAILSVLADGEGSLEMAERGRALARRLWSAGTVAARMMSVYREAIEEAT